MPVTYTSLKNKDIDVFLGNWMATHEKPTSSPISTTSRSKSFGANLDGAKYTLATNAKGAELGIKDFKDIAAHKDDLDGKIYGIEPGNDGNRLDPGHDREERVRPEGYGTGRILRTGHARRRSPAPTRTGKPIVFLGWEPHPMNTNFKLTYLTGGDDVFGPNFGGAKVYHQRAGRLSRRMPECRHDLKNLKFSLAHGERDHGQDPQRRQGAGSCSHRMAEGQPAALEPWLAGVTTRTAATPSPPPRPALGL